MGVRQAETSAPVAEPGDRQGRPEVVASLPAAVLALQRSAGNRATAALLRQPAQTAQEVTPATPTTSGSSTAVTPVVAPPVPRQDYVFLMGEDAPRTGNPFYTAAEAYYRTHLPNATFVTTVRTLADLLSWISTNVSQPIGSLYIISHANEDGTLSFGLDSGDTNHRLDVGELRSALHPASGTTSLTRLTNQVDAQTMIHIKGCDIGRTQAMVELIDEAFGGAGTVTAPTHEQEYGSDPELGERARRAFRAQVEANHPMPPPVDSSLRGAARAQAVRDRQQALRQRQADIQAELTSRRAEETRLVQEAARYEAFSGPLFQRTGTTLFTVAELRAEVDRLYGHLTERQRQSLAQRLAAPDPRTAAVADQQGTFRQSGQRMYRKRPNRFRFPEPRTVAEANAVFGADFQAQNFTPTAIRTSRVTATGGFTTRFEIDGNVRERGQPNRRDTLTFTSSDVVPDDATMLAGGRAQLPNPDRYAWRIEETHAG